MFTNVSCSYGYVFNDYCDICRILLLSHKKKGVWLGGPAVNLNEPVPPWPLCSHATDSTNSFCQRLLLKITLSRVWRSNYFAKKYIFLYSMCNRVIWMYYNRHVVIITWSTSVSCVASLHPMSPREGICEWQSFHHRRHTSESYRTQ